MNEINVPRPNNLDAFWMPYSDNKYFKDRPRMLARAEGMHYYTPEGREILDGTSVPMGWNQRGLVDHVHEWFHQGYIGREIAC